MTGCFPSRGFKRVRDSSSFVILPRCDVLYCKSKIIDLQFALLLPIVFFFSCGVQGQLANIFFTTVPQCGVIVINSILYTVTWYHIRKETNRIHSTIGDGSQSKRASFKAGKTMTLFVAVFLIQYWASATWGLWQTIDTAPLEIFFFVVTFSNIGGVLNCIVYFIMRSGSKSKTSGSENNGPPTVSERC